MGREPDMVFPRRSDWLALPQSQGEKRKGKVEEEVHQCCASTARKNTKVDRFWLYAPEGAVSHGSGGPDDYVPRGICQREVIQGRAANANCNSTKWCRNDHARRAEKYRDCHDCRDVNGNAGIPVDDERNLFRDEMKAKKNEKERSGTRQFRRFKPKQD